LLYNRTAPAEIYPLSDARARLHTLPISLTGQGKDAARLTEWAKDAAPSTELRQWYGHDPSRYEEFRRRYPGPQARDQFVFVGDEGSLPPDYRDILRYDFRPVLKRLKLYYLGFGWHAFRRQNVTWRQQVGGATPLEAQRAAGHGSLDMTYLYTLNDSVRERGQVQAMFDKLMETPEAKPQ
jgi:hypothetical protein